MFRKITLAAVFIGLSMLSSCDREPLTFGLLDTAETDCSYCHGGPENAAPPPALERDNPLAVGAHQAHVRGGRIAAEVACEECHIVPENVDDPGHLAEGDTDTAAEVVFGEKAMMGDSLPVWDWENARCNDTYCHGRTLEGGRFVSPEWTLTDGSQVDCDGCHGNPPPVPHPQPPESDNCASCHPETVGEDGEILIAGGTHIDGILQAASECYSCHGTKDVNDAPPLALDGSEETTARGVGAHQTHLVGGKVAAAVACEECHIVPENVGDPFHMPGEGEEPEADLTFGELARTGDLTPVWDRNSETCANTYCHGATLSGGIHTEPVWTMVDESQIDCDGCHGNPPPSPHPQSPQSDNCASCHPETVDDAGEIRLADGKHINGVLEATSECYSCHGREGVNDAPPLSLTGSSDTATVGVGAHQAHLIGGKIAAAVPCEECHVVPENLGDDGHLPDAGEDPQADLNFGTLAETGGLNPSWDRASETCSNTYCHGASLHGGNRTEPQWTKVDETQIECDSCHGAPPPLPHPQSPQADTCASCHPETVDADGEILLASGKHINGVVDTVTECSSCHGTKDVNDAPPVALDGSAQTGDRGVGAHQSHLLGGKIAAAVPCEECHVVPENLEDDGHLPADGEDARADLTFGVLATSGGVSPTWDRSSDSCSNTYCHGATLEGGNRTTPVWTTVDESQIACDSCHGAPPPLPHPQSPQSDSCVTCHPETVKADGTVNVASGAHINGVVNSTTQCSSCHGRPGVNDAPPLALDGSSPTAAAGVGAHQSHLIGGKIAAAVPCTECHVVPKNLEDDGHLPASGDPEGADLTFGALATTGGASPAWEHDQMRCADTYCHGATLGGGNRKAPLWTTVDESQIACDSCHGNPPPAPHPQSPQADNCASCHPQTVDGNGDVIVASGKHINGVVDTTTQCSSCHGTNGVNDAPPVALNGGTATSEIGVGAHQAHLAAGRIVAAVSCDECHIVPTDLEDDGHLPASLETVQADLTFGSLATANGSTPLWDRSADTCSKTYCHGATLNGGTRTSPVWTAVDGTQITCDSCHGSPPPAPHPQSPGADPCAKCHPDTVKADGTIDIASGVHVNGKLDLTKVCTACHGTNGVNAAPPVALDGSASTGSVSVGAHQAHLIAGRIASPVPCETCHSVPVDSADNGHIDGDNRAEVVFSGLAAEDGATPSWNGEANPTCQGVYCHGATLWDGTSTEPLWTQVDGSQIACERCHGFPPSYRHTPGLACETCHPKTVSSGQTINLANGTHIDGLLTLF